MVHNSKQPFYFLVYKKFQYEVIKIGWQTDRKVGDVTLYL